MKMGERQFLGGRGARRLGPSTHDLNRELRFKDSAQIGVYPNRRPPLPPRNLPTPALKLYLRGDKFKPGLDLPGLVEAYIPTNQ